MNTMCSVRELIYDKITHDLSEVGPRIPIYKPIINDSINIEASELNSIPYKVHKRCRFCGDGGIFDQDGKVIEFHQMGNIST